MAAFDRVLSGIPQMDECFDNIRLGDNVVWRVSDQVLITALTICPVQQVSGTHIVLTGS